ncbi:MAG: DnaB-like helicase C-terminal domain-containing protein, partial [Promethearchaeota archaeon]
MILYDNQYEQLAIGLMITNELATFKGVSELTDECFFDPNYRIVFSALTNLVNKQKEINIYNVNSELISIGQVLSLDDLISIEDKFYIPEKFDTIIDTLLDRAKKRKALIQIKLIESELETSTYPYETLIKPIGDLYNIHSDDSQEVITGENYLEIRKQHDKHKKTRIPLYTGYQEIDEALTYKLSTGEISIIAARPSNGKSAFKTNLIRNMCRRKLGIVSYALEQTSEVETDRMESIESGISLKEIANLNHWNADDPRWDKLTKAREEISTWNYVLLKGFNKSFFEMQSELRFLKNRGIKIVIWDLFDRIKDISISTTTKAQNVSRILNQFLSLADELDMHFCFLVQLNRKSVDKTGKKVA